MNLPKVRTCHCLTISCSSLPWRQTQQISPLISSVPRVRLAIQRAAMIHSRTLRTMMLRGPRLLFHEVFDSKDVPWHDNVWQFPSNNMHNSKMMPDDDNEEEYDDVDVTSHAIDTDTEDFSSPLFIAPDAARDPTGSETRSRTLGTMTPCNTVDFSSSVQCPS